MQNIYPWQRLTGEPEAAFDAFLDHLHLTESELLERHSPDSVSEWRLTYAWSERASRYHARRNYEEHRRAATVHSQEIKAFMDEQKSLASTIEGVSEALLEKAQQALEQSEENFTIGQTIATIRLVAELTKLSNDIKAKMLGVNQILKMRLKRAENTL